MPPRITTTTHSWVVAACIPVDPKAAKRAYDRQSVRAHMLHPELKIDALDVYCFAGETEFMTRDGIKTLGECAGTTQMVLTEHFEDRSRTGTRTTGRWAEAEIQSFGEQRVLSVVLARNGERRVIRATPNHRWFAARSQSGQATFRIVETVDLRPGMSLAALTPRDNIRQSMPSPFGVAHGVVYGDGSRLNQRGQTRGTGSYVDLWGDKDAQLLRYFNDAPTAPMKTANGVEGIRVRDLPSYFKDRPSLDESVPYLYGWLAGYFAADGTVDNNGAVTLVSARRSDLEFASLVADRLGMPTASIKMSMRVGIGQTEPSALYSLSFIRSKVRPDFLLIHEHRERFLAAGEAAHERLRWRVESVEDHGEGEEVFCAVVPDTHTFALADYLWTHNCDHCRRPYDDVADEECAAAESNEHLRGGPIGERAKRKHRYHDCDAEGCFPNGVRYGDADEGADEPPALAAR